MSVTLNSSVFCKIPGTSTLVHMLKNKEDRDLPVGSAMVYISKAAFDAIESTKEITLRPLDPCDDECLIDNGPIKRDSRLGVLIYYPSGNIRLALRESLCQKFKSSNTNLKAIKLQDLRTQQVSLMALQMKDIELLKEDKYVEYVKEYNRFLSMAVEARKQVLHKTN